MLAVADAEPAFPIASLRRLVLVLLGAFGALAVLVSVLPTPIAAERSIDRLLVATPGSATFAVGQAVSFIGSTWVVAVAAILLSVFVWRSARLRSLAVVCLAGPALAGAGQLAMKSVVGRTRPTTRSLTGVSGYSFPSGHTAGSAALAVVVVIVAYSLTTNPRIRRLVVGAMLLYAFAVGISRVVVGAHSSLDVVGGWLFGPAVALILLLGVAAVRSSTAPRGAPRPVRGGVTAHDRAVGPLA